MKPPAIRRFHPVCPSRRPERGITMVLVALAMVAIIAMAALSIDVITLYLAREEAQRSADTAALSAARVISMSGITGDPTNSSSLWATICGASGTATQAAQAVANQNAVGSAVATTVNVTYSAGSGSSSGSSTDCSTLASPSGPFGVNPMVTVQIQQTGLPTFFSRIWGRSGNTVSATATAEAFNPSNSGNVGNQTPSNITPVQPRCVKPWIVPNRDPLNPGPTGSGNNKLYCDQTPQTDQTNQTGPSCHTLVSTLDGSITTKGISLNGGNPSSGVIGEQFWLQPDCVHTGQACSTRILPPQGNYYAPSKVTWLERPPSLQYLPGEAPAATPVAIPSCASSGRAYEEAIAGCDQSTVYQCGVQSSSSANPNSVNLVENPGFGTNDTMNGVTCLINEGDPTDRQPDGQDFLNSNGSPSSYPFQIFAGSSNPLSVANSTPVTSSTSIVSLPIYDDSTGSIKPNGTTDVTIVGFLQVFINQVDQWGNVNVTVLNVAGCGGGNPAPSTAVTGSSPVPIRLITPP
jgi:hypothetical protein